jgi:hypothetical protein
MSRSKYHYHSTTIIDLHFLRYVLEQILSGEATENVVENIHEYLTTVGENVRGGKTKVDEFIIFKVRLSLLCQDVVPRR